MCITLAYEFHELLCQLMCSQMILDVLQKPYFPTNHYSQAGSSCRLHTKAPAELISLSERQVGLFRIDCACSVRRQALKLTQAQDYKHISTPCSCIRVHGEELQYRALIPFPLPGWTPSPTIPCTFSLHSAIHRQLPKRHFGSCHGRMAARKFEVQPSH